MELTLCESIWTDFFYFILSVLIKKLFNSCSRGKTCSRKRALQNREKFFLQSTAKRSPFLSCLHFLNAVSATSPPNTNQNKRKTAQTSGQEAFILGLQTSRGQAARPTMAVLAGAPQHRAHPSLTHGHLGEQAAPCRVGARFVFGVFDATQILLIPFLIPLLRLQMCLF